MKKDEIKTIILIKITPIYPLTERGKKLECTETESQIQSPPKLSFEFATTAPLARFNGTNAFFF